MDSAVHGSTNARASLLGAQVPQGHQNHSNCCKVQPMDPSNRRVPYINSSCCALHHQPRSDGLILCALQTSGTHSLPLRLTTHGPTPHSCLLSLVQRQICSINSCWVGALPQG